MYDKIETLSEYFKLLLPHKNMYNKKISEGIDKLIMDCKNELETYTRKCTYTYLKIEEYNQRLGLNTDEKDILKFTNEEGKNTTNYINDIEKQDECIANNNSIDKYEAFVADLKKRYAIENTVLLFYFLINEEKRLYIKITELYYKAKRIYDNIIVMKNYIKDDIVLEIDFEIIDIELYNKLKEIHFEYKAKVLEIEKQRNDYYNKIILFYKELEIEEFDSIDKQIINDYTSVDIINLVDKYNELCEEKQKRETYIKSLISDIQTLQTMLKDFYITDCVLEMNCTATNIKDLETMKIDLQKMYQDHFDNIFTDKHSQLTDLCSVFNIEMTDFSKTPESLEIMNLIIEELNNKKESYLNILDFKKKHKELKDKMIEFEKNASDPKRLFKSSFQLMSEEKFRKNAYPSLLNLENKIMEIIDEYENRFGVCEFGGKNMRNELVNEIENRIINRNVFIMNRHETPKKR